VKNLWNPKGEWRLAVGGWLTSPPIPLSNQVGEGEKITRATKSLSRGEGAWG